MSRFKTKGNIANEFYQGELPTTFFKKYYGLLSLTKQHSTKMSKKNGPISKNSLGACGHSCRIGNTPGNETKLCKETAVMCFRMQTVYAWQALLGYFMF